jgi:hypothetical protein
MDILSVPRVQCVELREQGRAARGGEIQPAIPRDRATLPSPSSYDTIDSHHVAQNR